MKSPILASAAQLLLPLFLGFSLYILLRGHNAPGGGFIGGLIAACGFAIQIFAVGSARVRRMLRFDPRVIGTFGLICALGAGFFGALRGAAPFEGIWGQILGLPVSTVLLFDTGVYLAVLGGVLALIFALEELD